MNASGNNVADFLGSKAAQQDLFTLRRALVIFEQESMSKSDDRPDEGGRRAIGRSFAVARTIAVLRHLADGLEANFESVEGYARTDRETRGVMSDGRGQCLYLTQEAAEQRSARPCQPGADVVQVANQTESHADSDSRRSDQQSVADRVVIRPFRITAAQGLEVLGE